MASNEAYIDVQLNADGAITEASKLVDKLNMISKTTEGVGKSTKVAFSQAITHFKTANAAYDKQAKKVQQLQNAYDNMDKMKLSDEYVAELKTLDKMTAKEEQMREKMLEIEQSETRSAKSKKNTLARMQEELSLLERKKAAQKDVLEFMGLEGSKYDTSEADAALQELNAQKAVLKDLGVEQGNMGKAAIRAANQTVSTSNKSKKATESNESKISKLKALMTSVTAKTSEFGSKAAKAFSNFRKKAKATGSTLKKFFAYAIGIRSLYAIFQKITSAMKEGYKNLAQYDSTTNKSISALKSSLTQLKNSLATAFNPLLTVATPAITALINKVSQLATAIGMLMARLTGQKTFTKAIAVQEDYAASLDNSSKSASNAVYAFDELNTVESADSSGSSGSVDPSQMFETIPVDNTALSSFFEPFKAAWETSGAAVMSAWNNALTGIQNLAAAIGTSFMAVWTNGTGELFLNNILGIVTGVLNTVGNLANSFVTAWNTAGVGTAIIQSIFDIANSVLGALNECANATAEWAANLNFTPLLEGISSVLQSLEPVIQKLSSVFSFLYQKVVLPFTSWIMEDSLPAFLKALSGGIDIVSGVLDVFAPLGEALITDFLSPIAEWTGGIICDVLTDIGDALTNIGDWVSEHSTLLQDLAIIIGSIATSIGLVNGAIKIFNAIQVIANGLIGLANSVIIPWLANVALCIVQEGLWGTVTSAVGVALNVLCSPITLVIAAIAAVIAIVILVIKHFGGLEETINVIKDKFTELKDHIGEILDGIKAKGKKVINSMLAGIEKFINGIVDGINNLLNLVNRFLGALSDAINKFAAITGINISANISVPTMSHVSLPRLATGTVVPRQASQFAAILGDNNRETEVVSPLSTIEQALTNALENYGGGRSGDVYISAEGDLDALVRLLKLKIDKEDNRVGTNYVKVRTV